MKKNTEKQICMLPVVLWIVIIPLIVKLKFYENPLIDYSWYSTESTLSDFFLYYKSVFVTIVGVMMVALLCWQICRVRKKDTLITPDTRIFIPIIVYLILVVLSSLFSKYGFFCTHGMPDQFETVWNLLAYVVAMFYFYYMIVYQHLEKPILYMTFVGVALISAICVLQYFKIDIYRLIYAGEGYSFTFEEGTVYGSFYNTNYVGFYTLLFIPLFILLLIYYKNWKVKILSAVLTVCLFIAMIGAKSLTAVIAFGCIGVFAVVFILLKNATKKRFLWFPIVGILIACVFACFVAASHIGTYLKNVDTETTNLENIYTRDDCVEIDYKGEKLFVSMQLVESSMSFDLQDQYQNDVAWEMRHAEEGYAYYAITDSRFEGIAVAPALLSQNPNVYGFTVNIDQKEWCFSNQVMEDGTYYYYTNIGTLAKLTEDTVSADFEPLVKMSSFASGRGYIWNKTIAILKDYIILGSGADTYALVFPNNDFVDRYNNGYDNLILTKPHNLYLQIAVQTGVLSLLCFLVFYLWYFISCLRLYFKQRLDNPLVIMGFAIMLGTFGYMISGLMNDSTITIAPLYWALLGMGIGINHRVRSAEK